MESVMTSIHQNKFSSSKSLDKAISEYENINGTIRKFLLLYYRIYYGHYEDTLTKLNQICDTIDKDNPINLFIYILSKLSMGEIYWRNGEFYALDSTFKEIEKFSSFLEKHYWIKAMYLRLLSIAKFMLGDVEKTINILSNEIPKSYMANDPVSSAILESTIGYIYRVQGKMKLSKFYYSKAYSVFKTHNYFLFIANCLDNLGAIEYSLQNVDTAIDHFLKSYELRIKTGNDFYTAWTLYRLCLISLEVEHLDISEYYDDFKKLVEKDGSKFIEIKRQIVDALILKKKSRWETKVKAKHMLKETSMETPTYEDKILCRTHITQLLVEEYKQMNNQEILEELDNLILIMLELTETSEMIGHNIMIRILRIQLYIIQLNFEKAKDALEHVKTLVEENKLYYLDNRIDELESEILKSSNYSTIENMLKDRSINDIFDIDKLLSSIEKNSLLPEEERQELPIMMIIMSVHGNLIYSSIFEEIMIQKHLIANFLTAILNFSQEVFSIADTDTRETNIFQIHDYHIVLKRSDSLVFSYIFQGNSFHAMEKITRFVTQLKLKKEIWNKLTSFEDIVSMNDKDDHLIDKIIENVFKNY